MRRPTHRKVIVTACSLGRSRVKTMANNKLNVQLKFDDWDFKNDEDLEIHSHQEGDYAYVFIISKDRKTPLYKWLKLHEYYDNEFKVIIPKEYEDYPLEFKVNEDELHDVSKPFRFLYKSPAEIIRELRAAGKL